MKTKYQKRVEALKRLEERMTFWDKVERTGNIDLESLSLKDLTKVDPRNFSVFAHCKLQSLNRDRTNLLKKITI